MKNFFFKILRFNFIFLLFPCLLYGASPIYKTIKIPVTLKDSSFNVAVLRVENSQNYSKGKNIFMIHGIASGGNIYNPLISTLTKDTSIYNHVYRIYSLYLPGHGIGGTVDSSEIPSDIKFGNFILNNYVETIAQVLGSLSTSGDSIDILCGHSMGGMLVQLLVQAKSSALQQEYGIKGIMLFASTLPKEIPWQYSRRKLKIVKTMMPFLSYSRDLGLYGAADDNSWNELFFTNTNGNFVTGIPVGIELSEQNTMESYTILSELLGLDKDLSPPSIDPSIFKNYYSVVVAFQEDVFMKTGEEYKLWVHLTEGSSNNNTRYYEIKDTNAVHNAIYNMPSSLKDPFKYIIKKIEDNYGYANLNNTILKTSNDKDILYYELQQNYPNPFNPSTNINFSIPQNDYISIKIYDMIGKEIETLYSGNINSGRYSINWNAVNIPAGIYFCKINSSNFTDVKKLILAK